MCHCLVGLSLMLLTPSSSPCQEWLKTIIQAERYFLSMVFPLVQCYYVNPVAHYLSCLGQNQDSQSMTSTSCSNPCQLLPALYSKAESWQCLRPTMSYSPACYWAIYSQEVWHCCPPSHWGFVGLVHTGTRCNHQHPYAQNKQAGAGFPP